MSTSSIHPTQFCKLLLFRIQRDDQTTDKTNHSYWMEYKTDGEGTVKHEKWLNLSFGLLRWSVKDICEMLVHLNLVIYCHNFWHCKILVASVFGMRRS